MAMQVTSDLDRLPLRLHLDLLFLTDAISEAGLDELWGPRSSSQAMSPCPNTTSPATGSLSGSSVTGLGPRAAAEPLE